MTIQSIFRLGKAAGVAAAFFACSEAQAQWFKRQHCPPQPCETPLYLAPGTAATPSTPVAPGTPSSPAQPAQPTPNLTDQLSAAATDVNLPSSFAGAGAPQNLAPNMIGDFFSGRGNTIQIPGSRPGYFDGARGVATWPSSSITALSPGFPIDFQGLNDSAYLEVRLRDGSVPSGFPPSIPLLALGVTSNLDTTSIANFTPGGVPNPVPLNTTNSVINDVYSAAVVLVSSAESALLGPGETLGPVSVTVEGGQANRLSGTGDPVVGEPYVITYSGSAQSTVLTSQSILVDVPSPSGGGIFGRLKLSENNSPMPRDRIFFDYSYFSDVPIAQTGAHVSVFRPGFEKTFLDGQASVEVRVPFAATVDSNITADGPLGYNSEFGNVTVAGKALLYSNGAWAYTAGCGLIMPTADDITVGSQILGRRLVQVNNQSYHLQPYLAALWTPNDRFFMQTFLQFDFALNGNAVFTDLTGAGMTKTGHLNDQTNLFWDVGMGFWLIRNDDGNSFVRGIAPIIEFHYNQSLNDADIVALGGLGVGDLSGQYSIINTTLGLNVDLRTNTSLMLGVVMPITSDRQFNYELGVQLNQRFGANARTPLTTPDF